MVCSIEIRINSEWAEPALKMGVGPINKTKIFHNYKSNRPRFADDRE